MLNTRKKVRIYLTIFMFAIFCLILVKDDYFVKEKTFKRKIISKDTKHKFSESVENYCIENTLHSTCFLGKLFCHPGYFKEDCSLKKAPANPWYTEDCPNLKMEITYSKDMKFELISQGKKCPNESLMNGISKCAYLCFSHPSYGVAQVPLIYWKRMLKNEVEAWKFAEGVDDRGTEHQRNFNYYADLPENLGHFIEIGSGPYTQTQFIHKNKKFDSITFLGFYIKFLLSNQDST